MSRIVVASENAPKAIGPYSQAIRAGGFVFCSGQIALDPQSGEMVGGSDVALQARRVMKSLEAVLQAAGSSFDKVVKTTIYLANMSDFATVNEIYGACFPSDPPARATVAAAASIDFIRSAAVGDELTAKCEERHRGRTTGTYDVAVTGPDDRTIALFRGRSHEVGGPVLPEP